MASHDQPPPNLPDGPYQKLSGRRIFILISCGTDIYLQLWVASYYYTHDARREVQPPTIVAVSSKNSLKLPPKADSK